MSISFRASRTGRVTRCVIHARNNGDRMACLLAGMVLMPTNLAYQRLLVVSRWDGRSSVSIPPGDSDVDVVTLCMDEDMELPDESISYKPRGSAPATIMEALDIHARAKSRVASGEPLHGDKTKATLQWLQKECWRRMAKTKEKES